MSLLYCILKCPLTIIFSISEYPWNIFEYVLESVFNTEMHWKEKEKALCNFYFWTLEYSSSTLTEVYILLNNFHFKLSNIWPVVSIVWLKYWSWVFCPPLVLVVCLCKVLHAWVKTVSSTMQGAKQVMLKIFRLLLLTPWRIELMEMYSFFVTFLIQYSNIWFFEVNRRLRQN